jgi:hypothetical protein
MRRILALAYICALPAFAADDKFPENKWFNGVKGLDEAQALQKTFGADIFLYFARYSPNDQKGLCNWFEKKGLAQPGVAKFLKDYLKVKIQLPLNRDDTEAVASFGVNKCPAVFIVLPNGRHNRCAVFDWAGNQPKPLSPDELISTFRDKSTARVQAPAAPPSQ